MNRFPSPPRSAAVLFLFSLFISSCALTSNGLDDPTPTPISGGPALTAESQPATLAPTAPVIEPSPTVPAPSVALVGALNEAAPGSLIALSLQGLQVAVAAHSLQLDPVDLAGGDPASAIRQAAADNLIVVVVGNDLAQTTRAVARDFPAVKFIGVDQAAVDSLPNYLVIGDPGNRLDEEGFLAGALAGLITQQHKIGLLTQAATLPGLLYKNGFIHGLRYTCGECELSSFELENLNDTSKAQKIATDFKSLQVDVIFAAAGPAGAAALEAATAQGLWVINLDQDLSSTPEANAAATALSLGSILRRPDLVLPDLIGALLNGDTPASVPFSLANGTLTYGDTFGPAVSPAVIQYLAALTPQLASGSLDTGVDLTTGAEK